MSASSPRSDKLQHLDEGSKERITLSVFLLDFLFVSYLSMRLHRCLAP